MKIRTPLMSIAAALTLAGGLAACSPAEQESAEAEVSEEAAQVGDAIEAGAREVAQEVGDAIEAGAREVAQEVDQATDDLAAEADEQRAETAADDESTTGDHTVQ